ncbi:MAG: hypothetical protein H6748_04300 [Spirochaetaceae bacterium]|nr:hypothetical protein [Myxococcales bacterium]MCB9723253.1 hypothetical protein [Spirochaetaceae bacterium]
MSTAFEQASRQLERSTDLDRLEARGTLRIMLKKAGFDAKSIGRSDLQAVIQQLLPEELVARGIARPEHVIEGLVAALAPLEDETDRRQPSEIFRRMIE